MFLPLSIISSVKYLVRYAGINSNKKLIIFAIIRLIKIHLGMFIIDIFKIFFIV